MRESGVSSSTAWCARDVTRVTAWAGSWFRSGQLVSARSVPVRELMPLSACVQNTAVADRLVLALPRCAPRNLQPGRVSHRRAQRPPAHQSQNPKAVTPKGAENRLR